MKKLKIAYADFWNNFVPEQFIFHKILSKYFEVRITTENPDFVFCSLFGNDFLNYSCPRILYIGEAVAPNFNMYDYAIGFDHIEFGDRYIRYPFSLMNKEILEAALHKHEQPDAYFTGRTKFCSFVVSSGGGAGNLRNWYFDKISEYKQVDSGGKFRNNLPDGQPVADKKSFQEQYRFSLAFENSAMPGYVTEKILDAWAAGTIPIYCGDPLIVQDYNEKAFIQCKDKSDLERVIRKIDELEKNPDLYLQMAKEPILSEQSKVKEMLEPSYLENFLLSIVSQEPAMAYRRNSYFTTWGKAYENTYRRYQRLDHMPALETVRKLKRKAFGNKKME